MTAAAHMPGDCRLNPPRSFISANRTRILVITIAAGLAAGLLLSPHAWFGTRVYPTTPILRALTSLPSPLDLCLYIALLVALAGTAIAPRPRPWIAAALVAAGIFVCFDQSRLQPWLYQYLIMLAAVAVYESRTDGDRAALDVCRLVVVCIYFWSGSEKINTDFIRHTFPWLILPITRFLPQPIAAVFNAQGLNAALTEIAIGAGLLTRRLRSLGVVAAVGMHAVLLFCLGPLGWNYNSIVWPWNVVMAACVFVLFWNERDPPARRILWPSGRTFHAVVLVLLGIAPALSFVNLWDQYLSFGLYVKPRNLMVLQVTSALASRLPKDLVQYVYPTDSPGVYLLDVPRWTLSELNLPVYPEPRIYKTVGKFICTFAPRDSDLRLLIQQQVSPFSSDHEFEYDCSALRR